LASDEEVPVALLLLQRMGGSHMWGAGWWWLVVLLFWVAVIALIVWAVRSGRRDGPSTPDPTNDARRILAERYARGEIDADEYRERLGVLS
jgi:putative membrane protein